MAKSEGAVSRKIDEMEEELTEAPWYSEGLRFKCTGCGKCCTGNPGQLFFAPNDLERFPSYVFLAPTDLERLANHFSLSIEEFTAKYTHKVGDKISLIERPDLGGCIFLKDKQCTVYEARPVQCRTFPWWIHILNSREDWEAAGKLCEGIEHPDAPVVPSLTIMQEGLSYLGNLLEQNFSS